MPTDTTEAVTRDREDMARLSAGHDAALNDLMERHATMVFHFLCRMVGNEDDANDLAQETFVRVFRAKDRFRPTEKFSSWVLTIAANLARNHFRWRSRHPTVPLDDPHSGDSPLASTLPANNPNPGEHALAAERANAVRAALARLPGDLREAIILCEWEDLTLKEAASILQTTPKAVESRLYRGRQLLRDHLKSWL